MGKIKADWARNAIIATAAAAQLVTAQPAMGQDKAASVTSPEVQQKATQALHALAGVQPVGILPADDMQEAREKIAAQIPSFQRRKDYAGLKKMASDEMAKAMHPVGAQSNPQQLGEKLLEDNATLSEAVKPGSNPHNYYTPDGDASFVVVPGSGKDLFKPTEADKTFFEKSTGIKNLDQTLGADTPAKTRMFCVLHETRHAGDPDLRSQTVAERRKGAGADLPTAQERGGEVRADLMAAQLYHGATHDMAYVQNWSHMRMMEMMMDDKARHVTSYALNDWIQSVNPKADVPPRLADGKIDDAYMNLRKTLWREGPALLQQKGIERPKGGMTQAEEGRYLMQAIKPCLDKGLIKDDGARTLAQGVQKAMDHFESQGANLGLSNEQKRDVNPSLALRHNRAKGALQP